MAAGARAPGKYARRADTSQVAVLQRGLYQVTSSLRNGPELPAGAILLTDNRTQKISALNAQQGRTGVCADFFPALCAVVEGVGYTLVGTPCADPSSLRIKSRANAGANEASLTPLEWDIIRASVMIGIGGARVAGLLQAGTNEFTSDSLPYAIRGLGSTGTPFCTPHGTPLELGIQDVVFIPAPITDNATVPPTLRMDPQAKVVVPPIMVPEHDAVLFLREVFGRASFYAAEEADGDGAWTTMSLTCRPGVVEGPANETPQVPERPSHHCRLLAKQLCGGSDASPTEVGSGLDTACTMLDAITSHVFAHDSTVPGIISIWSVPFATRMGGTCNLGVSVSRLGHTATPTLVVQTWQGLPSADTVLRRYTDSDHDEATVQAVISGVLGEPMAAKILSHTVPFTHTANSRQSFRYMLAQALVQQLEQRSNQAARVLLSAAGLCESRIRTMSPADQRKSAVGILATSPHGEQPRLSRALCGVRAYRTRNDHQPLVDLF